MQRNICRHWWHMLRSPVAWICRAPYLYQAHLPTLHRQCYRPPRSKTRKRGYGALAQDKQETNICHWFSLETKKNFWEKCWFKLDILNRVKISTEEANVCPHCKKKRPKNCVAELLRPLLQTKSETLLRDIHLSPRWSFKTIHYLCQYGRKRQVCVAKWSNKAILVRETFKGHILSQNCLEKIVCLFRVTFKRQLTNFVSQNRTPEKLFDLSETPQTDSHMPF